MDAAAQQTYWRNCSSCKNPIALGSQYYVCSVSTCNGTRTGYVFCSVACFERHLPGARHKDAGAIEKTAPTTASQSSTATPSQGPKRVLATQTSNTTTNQSKVPREVLIIASRLKEYIQARSECNTSASVMEVLSDHIRLMCDRAIDNAREDGRKTIMDRDFRFLKDL